MRVLPFPDGGPAGPDELWLGDLDAALDGDDGGALAESWRELRDDVRALAAPIEAGFERSLRQRLTERTPPRPARARSRLRLWLGSVPRPALGALALACVLIVLALVIAPWRSSDHAIEAISAPSSSAGVSAGSTRAPGAPTPAGAGVKGAFAGASAPASAAAQGVAPTVAGAGVESAPGRVQQLAASLSLTTAPANVQAIADGVGRLAAADGGYVQSANVQVRQAGQSEAMLTLRLPSRRLGPALASLAQLAPVSAESQSLQDITSTYDAARQRLADANAERQALLRALAGASSEAKIQALRAQLAQVRTAITQAHAGLHAVAQRASTAEVEVSVLGDAHAASEGLTLHRGLHDAGRVLLVSLIVLLLAAVVIVPLGLLLALLAGGRGVWRRYRRERALG
jgi:hypothetical protein